MRDRGVSDLLAFVLVFAIIVTSVGIVYTVGYDALLDVTAGSQSESAADAFGIVTQRLDELQRGEAVAWRGEFDLAGGTASVTGGARLGVTVGVDGAPDRRYAVDSGALVYESDRSRVVYEGGALFRGSDEASAMVREPPITCAVGGDGPDRAVVTVVRLRSDGDGSVASSGTVAVRAWRNRSALRYPENRDGALSAADARFVEVSVAGSPTEAAWERYFERSAAWQGDGPYRCPADVVYLRVVTLDVSL